MSKKRYWEWKSPSDFQGEPEDKLMEFIRSGENRRFIFTNGWMAAKYSLPSMECPGCGVWYEFGEFPFECPKKFRDHPNIIKRGPVSPRMFKEIVWEMKKEFEKQGIMFDEKTMDRRLWMQPGIDFQSWEFQIPCHPRYSFLWATLTHDLVVTEEVKQVFEKYQVSGVTFHPIKIAYVGKCEGDIPPDVNPDKWWDVEEYYYYADTPEYKVPPEENPESFGPLYHLRVSHFGPDWRDWDKLERCSYCGQYFEPERPEDIKFSVEHLMDYDMFRSEVLQGYIVSEKIYDLIQSHDFTNKPKLTPLDVVGL